MYCFDKLQYCENSWHILGEILNALPYPLAIKSVNADKIKDVLRHAAKPAILDRICSRLVQGSSVMLCVFFHTIIPFTPIFGSCVFVQFQTSAALGIAEFFEDLSEKDLVQEEVWKSYSKKYEIMAYSEMSTIERYTVYFI